MIPAGQEWAKLVYQNASSLRIDEAGSKLCKAILYAPGFLALGVQAFGSLPLGPVIVTIAVADAVFHCVAVRNTEFCQKAKHYAWAFDGIRLAALIWSVGHLFQTVLTEPSIFRTSSTYHPDPYNWRAVCLAICGMNGTNVIVNEIHNRIAKQKVLLTNIMPQDVNGVSVNITSSKQHLPTPSWIAVLQPIVYISLALFSKSHLVFAYLSGLYLYTFYKSILSIKACLRQIKMTLKIWRKWDDSTEKCFKYEERFVVRGKSVQKEVAREIDRLCQETAAFQPFNFQLSDDGTSCTMHCLEMPSLVSNPSPSGQISSSQLYMKGAQHQKIECKFVPVAYKPGMKIPMQIDTCDKNSKFLRLSLDNGTVAEFLDVLTSQVLKLGIKTIEATVESMDIKNGQLYLHYNSTELPKTETLAFTLNKKLHGILFTLEAAVNICEKGQKQAQCSECEEENITNLFYYELSEPYSAVCKSCITTDFENRVQNFTIVRRQLPFLFVDEFTVWADKEQLPEGSTLLMNTSKMGVSIVWLDYQVGKKMNIQLQKVREEKASGTLPDGTIVRLLNVDPDEANKLVQAQKTIDAQIYLKEIDIYEDALVLYCISRALPPTSLDLFTTASLQLRNGTPSQVHSLVECKPTLSNQDEICNICSNASEIVFYACAEKTHTACLPCLKEHLEVKCRNLKILNFRDVKVRNEEGQIVDEYPFLCFDQESLPNCLYCRSPVVDDSRLSVCVQDEETEVLLLDYKIDGIVQLNIDGFFQDGTPYGELDDGTVVEVKDLPLDQILPFFLDRIPLNAKILSKTIQNGLLCLSCTFISAELL